MSFTHQINMCFRICRLFLEQVNCAALKVRTLSSMMSMLKSRSGAQRQIYSGEVLIMNSVHIAKSNSPFCPYQFWKDYLRLADIRTHADEFIFRSVRFFRNSRSYKLSLADKPLSYTSMREIFLRALSKVGEEPRKFGLHSLRSGGATAAANADIPDRLFKAHGRWRSKTAKDGYGKDNINNILSVSKNLGL